MYFTSNTLKKHMFAKWIYVLMELVRNSLELQEFNWYVGKLMSAEQTSGFPCVQKCALHGPIF